MAGKKHSRKHHHHGAPVSNPVCIVPMHVPELAAAPAPAAELTYRGGPLIAKVQVLTIFWGEGWQQAPASDLVGQINQFFTDILASSLVDQLSEYSVPGTSIGGGTLVGTRTVTTPGPGTTVDDSDIRQFIQDQIKSDPAILQPGPNSLYFVYVQPGTTVTQGGSASCQAFCGYHDAIDTNTFYAVMPYPGCSGCTGGLDLFPSLTSTSSHELCEAITDPLPGQGWYDDANGEVGDICAWKTKTLNGYTVQLEWSNNAKKCI
jgi:hypothetical protein